MHILSKPLFWEGVGPQTINFFSRSPDSVKISVEIDLNIEVGEHREAEGISNFYAFEKVEIKETFNWAILLVDVLRHWSWLCWLLFSGLLTPVILSDFPESYLPVGFDQVEKDDDSHYYGDLVYFPMLNNKHDHEIGAQKLKDSE